MPNIPLETDTQDFYRVARLRCIRRHIAPPTIVSDPVCKVQRPNVNGIVSIVLPVPEA
jgi:hypothetical protein